MTPMRGSPEIYQWNDIEELPETTRTFDALVLAGGGGNGAWQAGRIKRLFEQGERWRAVLGCSAGGGNAIGAAMWDVARLERMWMGLDSSQVFQKDPSKLYTALRLLLPWGRRKGLRETSPLRATLRRALDNPSWQVPCWVGWCNYHSTDFELDELTALTDLDHAADLVHTSMAIPGLFEPGRVRYPGSSSPVWGMDGGTRRNCPVGAAIDLGARTIRVIIPSPEDLEYSPGAPGSAWDVAFRGLDAAMNQNTNTELRETQRWNDIVASGSRHGEEEGKVVVMLEVDRPEESVGSTTDFRASSIQRRFRAGYAWVRPS